MQESAPIEDFRPDAKGPAGGLLRTQKGVLTIMNESKEVSKPNTEKGRKRFHLRGFFSLLLFSSFFLLLFTGIILYVTPKGRVAHWTGWTMLGLGKEEWSAIHMTLALVVMIASGFHLYYNWGIFWSYITRKAQATLNLKREMALAILLCVVTVVGTLYGLPPFGTIIQWNDDIKIYWETHSAIAPTPHAEEFSIARLAEEIGMPLDQVMQRLKDAGVAVDDASVKVNDLAAAHGLTPSRLFAIVQPESRGMIGGNGHGRGAGMGGQGRGAGMGGHGRGAGMGGQGPGAGMGGQGPGYGRMTVQQCCESENIPVEKGLARLKEAGIEASSSEALKTLVERSGKRPAALVQIIRGQ